MPGEDCDREDDLQPIAACLLELDPGKRHEAQRHQADDDEGDAETLKPRGYIAVLELLANPGEPDDASAQPKPLPTP